MKYALRSEDTEQINVISWASWQMQKYPELKQKEFLTDMAAAGHYVATCYTARDAVEVLEKYLNLKCLQTHIHVSDSDTAVTETAERMKEQNNSVWKDGEVKPLKV